MELLPFDNGMKEVLGAVEKGTAMQFSAKSRPATALTAQEAARAATEATSLGSALTGKPLWEAIIQS
eukprot:8060612-Pyramimonas_sp.AAC.1